MIKLFSNEKEAKSDAQTTGYETRLRCIEWLLQVCGCWIPQEFEKIPEIETKSSWDWKILSKAAFYHGLQPLLYHISKTGHLTELRIPDTYMK